MIKLRDCIIYILGFASLVFCVTGFLLVESETARYLLAVSIGMNVSNIVSWFTK